MWRRVSLVLATLVAGIVCPGMTFPDYNSSLVETLTIDEPADFGSYLPTGSSSGDEKKPGNSVVFTLKWDGGTGTRKLVVQVAASQQLVFASKGYYLDSSSRYG